MPNTLCLSHLGLDLPNPFAHQQAVDPTVYSRQAAVVTILILFLLLSRTNAPSACPAGFILLFFLVFLFLFFFFFFFFFFFLFFFFFFFTKADSRYGYQNHPEIEEENGLVPKRKIYKSPANQNVRKRPTL
jgi:uncharacterized membrane protein